jgi:hypothetical protein
MINRMSGSAVLRTSHATSIPPIQIEPGTRGRSASWGKLYSKHEICFCHHFIGEQRLFNPTKLSHVGDKYQNLKHNHVTNLRQVSTLRISAIEACRCRYMHRPSAVTPSASGAWVCVWAPFGGVDNWKK